VQVEASVSTRSDAILAWIVQVEASVSTRRFAIIVWIVQVEASVSTGIGTSDAKRVYRGLGATRSRNSSQFGFRRKRNCGDLTSLLGEKARLLIL